MSLCASNDDHVAACTLPLPQNASFAEGLGGDRSPGRMSRVGSRMNKSLCM